VEKTRGGALRLRAAQILEANRDSDKVSRLVDALLISLISLNVLAIIIESVPSIELVYGPYLYRFEVFSVVVFTLEYFIRVWCCVDVRADQSANRGTFKTRIKYILSPSALIDLLAILPFYLSFFMVMDLRFLRVIRLLRIFKLTRYSGAMGVLLAVLREESRALMAAFFILFIVLILASSGIYLIEHDVQPAVFGSIPDAMWWAMSTLTTVGYGDVTPVTPGGKFFGGIITILGMGMVALPAGILASGFSAQLHRRRVVYTERLEEALADGALTHQEESELERLRDRLGLGDDDALALLQVVSKGRIQRQSHCPHCKKDLDAPVVVYCTEED
jgi:voltage-gated potassium channel